MFEVFEHTADLGLRIRAPDFTSLLVEAAQALFSIIVEDVEKIQCTDQVSIEVPANTSDYLLFDWLNELLFRFETDHRLFRTFQVHVGPEGLRGSARGEKFDPSRHTLSHEVKAITYHGLRAEQTPDGWIAEVIVDI